MKVLLLLGAVAVCHADPVTFSVEASPGQSLQTLVSSAAHSPGDGASSRKEPDLITTPLETATAVKLDPTTGKPTEPPKELNETPLTTMSKKGETAFATTAEKMPEPKDPTTAMLTTEKPSEATTVQIKTTEMPVRTETMPTPLAVAAGPASENKGSDKVTEHSKPVYTTAGPPETGLKVESKAEETPALTTVTTTTVPAPPEKTTAKPEPTTKPPAPSGNSTKTTKKPGNFASHSGSNLIFICFTILITYIH